MKTSQYSFGLEKKLIISNCCLVGSWSVDKDNNDDQQSSFIQTAQDLNKLVNFNTDSFTKTLLSGLDNRGEPASAGSTISNLYKRKRTSEEEIANTNGKNKIEESSPRKLEAINKLKQQQQSSTSKKSHYFMLSYLVNK